MSKKLVRATVPMCRWCGAEMERGSGKASHCTECPNFTYAPNYGLYVPDVGDVVKQLRALAEPEHGDRGDWVRTSRDYLRHLADELEGKS